MRRERRAPFTFPLIQVTSPPPRLRQVRSRLHSLAMRRRNATAHKPSAYDLIADKIEANPILLDIPLANIERWLARGHSAPHRLEQWRGLIRAAKANEEDLEKLLSILRDRSEGATHLRSFDPFHGVLTQAERQKILKQCAFSH